MAEENTCQLIEKCIECALRPANQYCNCEPSLLLCLFCARNHCKKIKNLEIENHEFSRDNQNYQEMPICPFEAKTIFSFNGITKTAMQSIKNIKYILEDRCSKWTPELHNYNNRYTEKEKSYHSQKLKEYDYCLNKIEDIINFKVESRIGFYSLHENLAKILDILCLINLVINYKNNENEWNSKSGPASNTIKAILVFNGDYSIIPSISNWFGVLTMEDALNVLRTSLIMEYNFSNSFICPILEFLNEAFQKKSNELTKKQTITQNQKDIFLRMSRKLSGCTDYISNEILNPILEELQSDQDKALTIISDELLIKNTQYEGALGNLIFGLEYWKIDNSLVVVYILMLQASACKKVNNFQKAEELLNHALHELYETTGELHPLASECMIWLAESYMNNQNRWPYSLKLFEKALDLRMKNPDWYERDSIVRIISHIQYLRGILYPN